jgi:hypothetical protein
MSFELDLLSKVMYLCDGEVQPGEAAKVARFERKMMDWKQVVLGFNESQEGRNVGGSV